MAPINSHEDPDGGAGDEVRADGLQPSKRILNPWPMPRIRLAHSFMPRPTQMADEAEGACQQTSAESAEDLVIGHFSVRREEERAGDEEVAKDVVEEVAAMLQMVEAVRFSLLL